MRIRPLLAWLVLLSSTAPLWTAPPAFRKTVVCPPLCIRLPEGSKAEQLPPVETFRYQRTFPSGAQEDIECYDPEQLWRSEQCLGRWTDRAGNQFELLVPTSRRGGPYPREHITREEYETARKAVGPLQLADLGAWIADWCGATCTPPEPLRAAGTVRQARFTVAGQDALLLFFMKATPATPYLLRVTPVKDSPQAWKQTLRLALAGFALNSKIASASASAEQGWITLERPPYRVYTDLPRKDHRSLNHLLNEMQLIRAAYAALFPQPKDRTTPVSTIRIFGGPEAYRAYVGEGMEWSSGVFSSTKRELVVLTNGEEASAKARRDDIRRTTFHEGFHQYLFLITPPRVDVPTWFNEGHATYFETFRFRNGKGKPALSNRLEVARGAAATRSAQGLANLMAASRESFYGPNRNAAYAVSWLLVHWLRTKAPGPLNTALDRYYALLCSGTSPAQAQAQIFPQATLETIAQELDDYLSKNQYDPS